MTRPTRFLAVPAILSLMPIPAAAHAPEDGAVRAQVEAGAATSEAPEVTARNWYWGPANRWSWHNSRRLFPTARIGHGDGAPVELPEAPQELGGISFFDPVAARETTVAEMLDRTDTDAFLVLHKGTIVFETYRHGMALDDPHLLMSMTKSVVGSLAGILIERGEFDEHKLVTDYIPELHGTIYEKATIRHVLDMVVADPGRTPAERVADYEGVDTAAGWLPPPPDGTQGLRAWLQTLRFKQGKHGGKFLYLTQNTTVASWAMQRATGKDFAQLLTEEIWSKLGAESDAYVLLDGQQEPYTSPGLNVTLRDLARFGRMMAQNGQYNGQQIVPASWIKDIRENGDQAAKRKGSEASASDPTMPGDKNSSYRSFWWITGPQCGRFAAIGLGGQLMVIDPVTDVVVVKYTSSPNAAAGSENTLTAAHGINAIISALTGHHCS